MEVTKCKNCGREIARNRFGYWYHPELGSPNWFYCKPPLYAEPQQEAE